MAGDTSEERNGSDGFLNKLRLLAHEEILQVLSDGLCQKCLLSLDDRAQHLLDGRSPSKSSGDSESSNKFLSAANSFNPPTGKHTESKGSAWSSRGRSDIVDSGLQNGHVGSLSPSSVNSKQAYDSSGYELMLSDGLSDVPSVVENGIPEDEKERIRFLSVGRKRNFVHFEKIDGRKENVLRGLELYTQVFNVEEQKKIVGTVYGLQQLGQEGRLRARTYTEPRKWMRGKGRVTIQFGCCYNYAVDKDGNPPGIVREEDVDPLPPVFKKMIIRMVKWKILPSSCVPNSCIVNIYDEGDCIPPHIDHHDFLRPFCTVSFLTQCEIVFGVDLKIVGPGSFKGPASIPLPVGSVLVLNGNGADVAKHCVPCVRAKRISITFRRMDDRKIPYNYSPDPELMGIKPLFYSTSSDSPAQQHHQMQDNGSQEAKRSQGRRNWHQKNGGERGNLFAVNNNDFPPLGSSRPGNQRVRR